MAALGSEETVEVVDVGGDPRELPFEFRPGVRASPLVVSFPHVGLDWPASLGPRPQVSFPRNADYAIDRVYARAEALGAATIRARYSRLVVDLNRAEDDVSLELVPDHPCPRPRGSLSPTSSRLGRPIHNRGVVWASAVGNIPLLDRLSHADLTRRLDRFYRPYYRAIALLLARRQREFGYAILLDAHSMPSSVAGDLVLGTRAGRSCGPAVRSRAEAVLAGVSPTVRARFSGRWPLDFAVDDPYQGGELVRSFGQPEAHVHALQLEVNRGLYMDELRCEVSPLPRLPDPTDPGDHVDRVDRVARAQADQARTDRLQRGSRPAQGQRERRRLAALVTAVDALVLELSRVHDELASAAE